jgi:hypothetical protein
VGNQISFESGGHCTEEQARTKRNSGHKIGKGRQEKDRNPGDKRGNEGKKTREIQATKEGTKARSRGRNSGHKRGKGRQEKREIQATK